LWHQADMPQRDARCPLPGGQSRHGPKGPLTSAYEPKRPLLAAFAALLSGCRLQSREGRLIARSGAYRRHRKSLRIRGNKWGAGGVLTSAWANRLFFAVQFRCASALPNLAAHFGSETLPWELNSRYGCHWMNYPRPILLVLADDHPVVLQGIAAILQSQPDIHVAAVCADGIAAAKAIRLHLPDVAVLDITCQA
jgi:hypothetical protein